MIHPVLKLWSTQGRVGRGTYLLLGAVLFAIKHNIDRFVASFYFDRPWSLFNYWVPGEGFSIRAIPASEIPFYMTLLLIAVAFIWIGVVLTLRRLRDAHLPLWLVLLFFIPVVNLFFFMLMSVLPSANESAVKSEVSGTFGRKAVRFIDRLIPHGSIGSAAAGILVTLVLATLATQFSVDALGSYGWGLFVGVPFFIGLTSVLIYGCHQPRGFDKCLAVSSLAIVLFGGALAGLAIEGLICIIMAAPIGFMLSILGGSIGYVVQRREQPKQNATQVYSMMFLAVPLLMIVEAKTQEAPRLVPVQTSVEINAAPERVWQHVIALSELPPPDSWLFSAGIAYPMRAEIKGHGVGAVRHCVFSTGPFVEPIEVWQEARLLKFSVTAQPSSMREISPYGNINTPHLDDYLVSRGGQFLLTPLPGGRTRLEGTTWYEVHIRPERYWQVWSDIIIHRIHLRVLNHVKQLSEH